MIRIERADPAQPGPRFDSTFVVDRRLDLRWVDGRLRHELAAVSPYEKAYPPPRTAGVAKNQATFIAFAASRPAGRIDLSQHWNGFAFIDDLVVDLACRRAGVARALLAQARDWALAQGLPGIMAETQDTNVPACMLYERCGFALRGFDAGLYRALDPRAGETALFWYWEPGNSLLAPG